MSNTLKKSFHTGTVKKTITIKSSKDKVWRKISNIIGLPTWVVDVKKTASKLAILTNIFLLL